jgi:hypothetical protein
VGRPQAPEGMSCGPRACPKAVRIRLGVEPRHAVLVSYRAVQAVIAVYPRSMPLISQEFVYTRSRATQPEAPLRYRNKHPRHDVSALVLRKMGGSSPYRFVGIFTLVSGQ